MASVTRCVGLVGPEPINTLGRVTIGRRKVFGGNTRVESGSNGLSTAVPIFTLVSTFNDIVISLLDALSHTNEVKM